MNYSTFKKLYANFRSTYHLELHMLLFFFSTTIFTSAAYPLFYTKVCQDMYKPSNDSSQIYICDDFEGIQSNDDIQKESTNWIMYGELAKFFPNIFGAMFLGSFGDHHGRKIPMLVTIASFLLYLYLYWAFVSFTFIPIYAVTIMGTVTAFGGTLIVFLSSQFSEVADYITDENKLTVRYAILTAFWSGAIVVGGNIAPFLLTSIGYDWTLFLGVVLMVAAFFSVLIFFPNKAPESERKLLVQNSESKDSSETSNSTEGPSQKLGWLYEGLSLYKSAWRTLNKTRPHHGRIYLVVYCIVGIIYACEDSGLDPITVLYVYHDPLSWSPELYTWWGAMMSLCQLLGSVIGAIVFKKLKISDNMILIISMFSAMLKMTGVGIGQYTWVMFLSLLLGSLSTVGFSAIRALVVQLGTQEETGELLSLINLSVGWCTIFSALVFNNVYKATIEFYGGFCWILEAILLFFCLLAILVIYIQTRNRETTKCEVHTETTNEVEKF